MPGAGSDDAESAAGQAAGGPPEARPSGRQVARRDPDGPSVLPDTTTDERDLGWGEVPEPDDDERYLREVPPHHGD